MEKREQKKKKTQYTSCETCMFYDYDEFMDDYVCNLNLDEDEMIRFMQHPYSSCPYYKFYDEYKMEQKQN